jgi:hypothetical protein
MQLVTFSHADEEKEVFKRRWGANSPTLNEVCDLRRLSDAEEITFYSQCRSPNSHGVGAFALQAHGIVAKFSAAIYVYILKTPNFVSFFSTLPVMAACRPIPSTLRV